MNIIKYELKTKLKFLIFWCFGIILLLLVSSMEFEGISGANSESVQVVLDYYPPIVLALMGITEEIPFTTLLGYSWVLGYIIMVCVSIYGITLGMNVVNREVTDKTYEFLFTKPRKRRYILSVKILSSIICLAVVSFVIYLGFVLIMAPLDTSVDGNKMFMLSSLSTYIVSLIFFALSIFISSVAKTNARSGKISYLYFLFAFLMGAVYDVAPHVTFIRILTPLRYFTYHDAIDGTLSRLFIALSLTIIVSATVLACNYFEKKDFTGI